MGVVMQGVDFGNEGEPEIPHVLVVWILHVGLLAAIYPHHLRVEWKEERWNIWKEERWNI
jgi:hypothetical protein